MVTYPDTVIAVDYEKLWRNEKPGKDKWNVVEKPFQRLFADNISGKSFIF
jgi:hypothetical protein